MPKNILDTVLEKFMRYVDVPRTVKQSPCWLWAGSTDGHGYGQISNGTGKTPLKAHRVAWSLAYGEIPSGMFVCHRCDNPRCVRPAHLFLGTALDNMDDCSKKGRVRRKITPEQAWEIRYMIGSHRAIAAKFGIVKSAVSAIRAGKTWKNAYPAGLAPTRVNYVPVCLGSHSEVEQPVSRLLDE